MNAKLILAALLGAALIGNGARAAEEVTIDGIAGFKDTPLQPGGRWHVHDPERPQPAVVAPGTFSTQAAPGKPPADAIVLFDGKDLARWRAKDGQPAAWRLEDGAMVAAKSDIVSTQEFGDVQLHVEFSEPQPAGGRGQGRGNSGVFLMDKYEVQVVDCYQNRTYADGSTGALYGQHPPLVNACLPPGQWQVYDILFTAPRFKADGEVETPAYVTVLQNGIVVQNHQSFRGPTGWQILAKYTPHGPAGPIGLQFHNNPVRYRSIWVRPLAPPETP